MWDVFISYASEDKETVAHPLAESLRASGIEVWYDAFTLTVGDRLRQKIEDGLRRARYGVVVLSRNFFAKKWPTEELDALFALETPDHPRILPIWHGVTEAEVKQYALLLAGRYALSTDCGVEFVASAIVDKIAKYSVMTHHRRVCTIDVSKCHRDDEPVVPPWFADEPERISSSWLKERLGSGAALRLYYAPHWCDGTWFVVDLLRGDGEVINLQQLDDLRPSTATTTTQPPQDQNPW